MEIEKVMKFVASIKKGVRSMANNNKDKVLIRIENQNNIFH